MAAPRAAVARQRVDPPNKNPVTRTGLLGQRCRISSTCADALSARPVRPRPSSASVAGSGISSRSTSLVLPRSSASESRTQLNDAAPSSVKVSVSCRRTVGIASSVSTGCRLVTETETPVSTSLASTRMAVQCPARERQAPTGYPRHRQMWHSGHRRRMRYRRGGAEARRVDVDHHKAFEGERWIEYDAILTLPVPRRQTFRIRRRARHI